MLEEYCCITHAMEGRDPEFEEIQEYLKRAENIEIRKNWTYICSHANKDNWPDIVKRFREELNIPEDVSLKNEERIRAQIEKATRERAWIIREL